MTTPNVEPTPTPHGSSPTRHAGPRVGPIVWGALILTFCGYITQRVFAGPGVDGSWWLIASIIGLGVLLLGIGLTVILRGRGR